MYRLIALITGIILCVPLTQAQAQQPCQPPTPPTFSREQNIFTEEQESDLGDAIAEHIQRFFRVIDDEEVTGYLNRIGQRIIKHLPKTNLRFQFLLIDDPDANAFVLPGGRVYFSRKAIALAQSEDEIAGVIGHEIGHLLARQQSVSMTRRFREVLGVTEVKDRRDIFEKYNQLVENAARKPKAFGDNDKEKDQIVADQIGLFAAASAGYDPQGLATFFDRLTENKGNTGGFFSDLFGTTKPEAKRVREMLKKAASLPPSCIDARSVTPSGEFQKWQASVTNYTGPGRKESLHAVLKKITLEPPLRSDITHMRFSPDGKFLLAQDDSGINVLTREPFAFMFHINAPEARPAQFTPDSQRIIFYNSAMRVEEWGVAEQKLTAAHELFIRKRCFQTQLSPDGKVMACLDSELSLNLFDVASGAQVFQKKSFYTPDMFRMFISQLRAALSDGELDYDEFTWINMGFSPDAHYFAAGALSVNAYSGYASDSALAVDLTTRQTVSLRGPLKKLLSNGFVFLGPDRLIGVDREKPQKSPVVSFPAGEVLNDLPLGAGKLDAPTRGNYLLIRPIKEYKVGVMDLATKKFFLANRQGALDLYDDVFVSERINGELGLYGAKEREMRAKVILPRNMLGRLRATALSKDMKWLAVSERSRGAVWNLAKGERAYHVRGFRGGYFADDDKLYADFPKFEQTERGIAQLELARPDVSASFEIKEDRAYQIGQFMIITKPAKEGGDHDQNVILEVRDVRNFSILWSKPFPKEAPDVWTNPREQIMACLWPVSSDAAKVEIKNDPALGKQLAAMKEKEGDYFLQALDARTGNPIGRLLIETGKGSFRISSVTISGDWVLISDTQNRVLIYSLSSGEQKGKVFGSRVAINQSGKLLCVENESGQLTIYELASMEKRDRFVFSSPVSLVRFGPDGKSLFVLTANQTVYVLDVSALIQ